MNEQAETARAHELLAWVASKRQEAIDQEGDWLVPESILLKIESCSRAVVQYEYLLKHPFAAYDAGQEAAVERCPGCGRKPSSLEWSCPVCLGGTRT